MATNDMGGGGATLGAPRLAGRWIWVSDERVPPMLAALLTQLHAERQSVTALYRGLGWSRQQLEQLIQTERGTLATLRVRLHVATHAAAAGRKERYVSMDGVRYSAISWDHAAGGWDSAPRKEVIAD